jgi:AraC-like DNA-binding protein/ligand-binding sensor protein
MGFMSTSAVYDALVRSTLAHELESAFTEATGMPVELVPSGEPAWLFRSQRRENALCSLMAQHPGSCAACQQTHAELQTRLSDRLVPEVTSCFAGLSEFAVPVIVGDQHVATLLGGQIFQREPIQAQFERLKEQLGTWGIQPESQRIETAYFETRVISRKQFQASLRLLTIFAKFLAEDANRDLLIAQIHDQPCITSAKNFILAHASEPLRLRDVAQHVHISTHYFCKFFKKTTGIGFSEFLARARVENAKDLLANPALLINDVANQAGFGSLSQFNRAFRRYEGCSPKEFRAALLQTDSS